MNVKSTKQAEARIEYPSIATLGIQAFGYNNLYPQQLKALVANSESATSCLHRYTQFVQGNGFLNVPFAEMPINPKGETPDDLLQLLAADLAHCGGIAIHVNYNLLAHITSIHHIPFQNCRLTEQDAQGDVHQVALFADWTATSKRNGKTHKPSRQTVDYIHLFDPNAQVVLSQIKAAGGIENYKGQVLWLSSAGPCTYPKPLHDCVVSQMSTEEGLGNIAYRNTRNNFAPAGMLITRKGQDIPHNSDYQDYNPWGDNSIAQSVAQIQGDLNTNKILHFEIEYDEEKPEFVNFQGTNYDKDFSLTSDTVCEKIYAAFGQEAWHRIRKGSIGFSSDILTTAYESYSSSTGTQRRMLERAFDKLFKHWHTALPTSDFSIQPLVYVSNSK